ncbi:hypothetical protein TSUD_280830 [Trifolium subterraneum]|uniref:Putative plant transposon protein domain-containing protein n=1 Tax=Trifolium subterraneum TaxID=3900 RepID=A0A2Z6NQ06_TRISU|nr:hypothetical protein TSUD_280830 [Trifolium subterraneum]
MAQTKNPGGRKVPRTKNPSVSSSPPQREASAEIQSTPLPTNMQTNEENPPNSPNTVFQSSQSESPENSPIQLTQNQLQASPSIESLQPTQNQTHNEDSPSPAATVPRLKDTPPALVKIKKSKSFDSSKIRRSSRIMYGAGKKPVVDTTVHILDPSDSENTLSENEIDELEVEKVTSTKSEPAKVKNTPTPKKKLVETAVKAPGSKKKINLKKPKGKILEVPLILPEDEEVFEQYWKTKPVAPSRLLYNFGELSQGGVDIVKYVKPFEWKSFFHIKETVYPLLVQAFYYNAKVYPDKDLITSHIKGVELVVDPYIIGDLIGIKSEGVEVYGNDWYDQVKVNKEDLKEEMFTKEGGKKNSPPSSMLKTEYKLLHNMCQHSFFPRTGSKDKVTDLDLLLMVFRLYYADMNDTPYDNHYFTFNMKNVSYMKKEVETPIADVGVKRKREVFEKTSLNLLADVSGDRLENALQTDGNTKTSVDSTPTTESEKLVTTAAATLQEFNPIPTLPGTTINILTSDTPEFSTMPIPNPTDNTLPFIPSSFATPAKRSRLKTDMEQMRRDMDYVIKGITVQQSMMNHLIVESKNLRNWFANVVCPQLHINPPPEIATPHFDPFPAQNNNYDDDVSPTTSPAPDGANE